MATRKQLEQQFIEDRAFWGSVGARWRGLASGVALGLIAGAILGAVVAGAFALFSGLPLSAMVAADGTVGAIATAKTAALGIIGVFSGAGALVGGALQGLAGSISGAVASAIVARKEIEQDPSRPLDKELHLPPIPFDASPKQPLFNWKVMGLGALATGAIGAFMAYTGTLPAPVSSYLLLGQTAGTGMAAAAAATTMGAFGAIFGIALKPWQSFKKWTDGLFEGRVTGRTVASMTSLKEQLLTANAAEAAKAMAETPAVSYTDRVLQERQETVTVSPQL